MGVMIHSMPATQLKMPTMAAVEQCRKISPSMTLDLQEKEIEMEIVIIMAEATEMEVVLIPHTGQLS